MKTSSAGRKFIEKFEGYTPYVYSDPNGDATSGPGIFLHRGPPTRSEIHRYGTAKNPKLSRTEYDLMMTRGLRPRETALKRLVNKPVNQCEFDALMSLLWNIGEGGFEKSTVRRELNRGHRFRAGAAFMMWVRGSNGPLPGLVRRRRAERRLFRGKTRKQCGKRVRV